jgi:hypothetical protein
MKRPALGQRSATALALAAATALTALGLTACLGDSPEPATLVMRGGRVHTMDARGTQATAVAVRGNHIVAVGSDADVYRYIGARTQVIELQGHAVLPGFIDTHIHPVMGAERLAQCSVDGVQLTVADIVSYALADCLPFEQNPSPEKWIQIANVNPAGFVATTTDLDQISSTRPVALHGIDGHTEWVNHVALQRAGITAATPDPVGGQIERDANGEPTGFLKDDAQGLVDSIIPPLSADDRIALTAQALALARSHGITSVQDAWASQEALDTYEAMEGARTLDMRVRASLMSTIGDDEAEYQRLIGIRAHFAGHPLVRADSVKIFSDGVIEYPTQTAAMTKPYLDANGQPTANLGGRYFDTAVLGRYVTRLDKEGFSVHVHSIGDYTTHALLDAFETAKAANGDTGNRHEIAHLQIVDPADFPRFAQLGVYANMQLFWALPDEYSIDAVQPFIAPDLFRYMYPAGSLKAAGATIIGGSDWPVDAMPGDPMPNTPLSAAQSAITRANPFEPAYAGMTLDIEEAVTIDDVMAAYTINAARALKQDATTGSIEVGKLADLVILDQDPWQVDPTALLGVTVLDTIFDGRIVHDAASAGAATAKARTLHALATLKRLSGHEPAKRPTRDHTNEVHPAIVPRATR